MMRVGHSLARSLTHHAHANNRDTLKVRLQTAASTGGPAVNAAQAGALRLLATTVRHEGFLALYRGASSRVAGSALGNSVLFGSNGEFKRCAFVLSLCFLPVGKGSRPVIVAFVMQQKPTYHPSIHPSARAHTHALHCTAPQPLRRRLDQAAEPRLPRRVGLHGPGRSHGLHPGR